MHFFFKFFFYFNYTYTFILLQCINFLHDIWCLFLLLAAEDDPDDADFEPDYGVTSSRTANKVQIFCIILINYI